MRYTDTVVVVLKMLIGTWNHPYGVNCCMCLSKAGEITSIYCISLWAISDQPWDLYVLHLLI